MLQLPDSLRALAAYNQFILWKLVDNKKKLPVDHRTLQVFKKDEGWQQDPTAWTSADNAINLAAMCGDGFGVGFYFNANDPFYFVDLDNCLSMGGDAWSPVAMDILGRLPGAAVEVSQSGKGLHIIGKGQAPEHSCKNVPLGLELYTEGRFVALTGINAIGDSGVDSSIHLPALVNSYFPPKSYAKDQQWTTEAVEGVTSLTDEELIDKACGTQSAAGAFGGGSTFAGLWEGDEERLAESYPDEEGKNAYDRSSADAALAQHLAFWTGNNCQRILAIMWQSGLVRDKWREREGYYLERTILRAASMQTTFYTGGQQTNIEGVALAEQSGAPKLRASSDAQRNYATNIRAQKLVDCAGNETLIQKLCASSGANATAKFWLDNQERTPEELVAMVTPIDSAADPMGKITGPEIIAGHQYLGATLQIEHFAGCVYVQDLHQIFIPSGSFLKPDQFNATYGGYIFQLDETGDKTTRKAWEAFTESQVVRYPKAEGICFRPAEPEGMLVEVEGRVLVNTYVELNIPNHPGDITPFLEHLKKLLPIESDRNILLAYMAACIQHKGVKFQWAPLIQGAEGNGKTLLTRCVAFAVGKRYTHYPKASQLDSNFNGWMTGKLFYGVEDIYVPDHKKEIIEALKPMITGGDGLEIEKKGVDQITIDICGNFIFNSNYKDAVRKTRNDRRFCIFYTAQQTSDDITRDGMDGDYFPKIYNWLKAGGYARVTHYLKTYAIPAELNPSGACHRAPITTSTEEAVTASLGAIEQEILEAIDEGRPGFAGGWVSSMAVDRLLQLQRMTRAIPHNKRRDLMQTLGYDWHPALTRGRVNNFVAFDAGKPRLFIKNDHIHSNLTTPSEVVKAYQDAQGPQSYITSAAQAFQ